MQATGSRADTRAIKGLLDSVASAFAVVAVAAAVCGAWLVATVDREFAPRGAIGTLSLILAALLGGAALVTWRHSRQR